MTRTYTYVGPPEILKRVCNAPGGTSVKCPEDVVRWIQQEKQVPEADGLYWVTYVISTVGELLIADRHSEHVVCAAREPVLAAGELALELEDSDVVIVEVSNLSTGFCPEPSCWTDVAAALERTRIPGPAGFTVEYVFRLCPKCSQRNIVKGDDFHCACCGASLPLIWNFKPQTLANLFSG